jgi:rhombotail lipoprotein
VPRITRCDETEQEEHMNLSMRTTSAVAATHPAPDCRPRGKTVTQRAQNIVAMLLVAVIASGCGSMAMKQSKQNASLVDYLYAGQQPPEKLQQASIAELKIPMRIGIAFVPGAVDPRFGITEVEQIRWSTQIKAAFEKYPFVSELVVIPTAYLKSGGGFDNLRQLAKLFNVEVVALLSYDQIQFSEPNKLSMMYWTGIGVYLVPGDQYDIHTVLEATVFDVRTGKLLFRAPGTSTVKGSAAWIKFSDSSRQARSEGFDKALEQLIPNVDAVLQAFRRQAQDDPAIKLSLPAGYDPNALRPVQRGNAAR